MSNPELNLDGLPPLREHELSDKEKLELLRARYDSLVDGGIRLQAQLTTMHRQARVHQQQIDRLSEELNAARTNNQSLGHSLDSQRQKFTEEIRFLRGILTDNGIHIPDRGV